MHIRGLIVSCRLDAKIARIFIYKCDGVDKFQNLLLLLLIPTPILPILIHEIAVAVQRASLVDARMLARLYR